MFDIGWGELVLIGLVALIVIGPKELPTVLRTAGQWMGRVKRMASEFQGQFQEALREAEVADLKQHADDLTGELKSLTEYDPMADADKGPVDESGWDEPPYEPPTHHETLEHTDTTPELEKPADGHAAHAASEPAAAERAVTAEKAGEDATDLERAPAVPVVAVEAAPADAAESAPASETPPPKQAGGTA